MRTTRGSITIRKLNPSVTLFQNHSVFSKSWPNLWPGLIFFIFFEQCQGISFYNIPKHKNILLQISKDIYSDTSIAPFNGIDFL